METLRNWRIGGRSVAERIARPLIVVGLGLVGWGTYLNLRLGAQLSAGRCDGCAPWHPLFVVAPILLGAVLVLSGTYVSYHQ